MNKITSASISIVVAKDGMSYQLIYTRTTTDTAPSKPERSQSDNVPTGWAPAPMGVDDTYKWEWVSQRIKTEGVWDAFSDPALFSYRSDDGRSITIKGTAVAIYTGTHIQNPSTGNIELINTGSGSYDIYTYNQYGSWVGSTVSINDGYIYDGDLWVNTARATWENVGQIVGPQGPPGDPGVTYYMTGTRNNFQMAMDQTYQSVSGTKVRLFKKEGDDPENGYSGYYEEWIRKGTTKTFVRAAGSSTEYSLAGVTVSGGGGRIGPSVADELIVYALESARSSRTSAPTSYLCSYAFPVIPGGKSAGSVSQELDSIVVDCNAAGYVTTTTQSGLSPYSFNISYYVGTTQHCPTTVTYNGTSVATSSASFIEKNFYIRGEYSSSTIYYFTLNFDSTSSDNDRIYLNGGTKKYTFEVGYEDYPTIPITVELIGNMPTIEWEKTQKGYLALSVATNTSDPDYLRPPSAIPMHCWSADWPTATQSKPYIWMREEIVYSNGETDVTVSLVCARGNATCTFSQSTLTFETNPNKKLLKVETPQQITAQLYLNNVMQEIDYVCINIPKAWAQGSFYASDSRCGVDYYIIGGYKVSDNSWQACTPIHLSLNNTTHYINDGVDYGPAIQLQEAGSYYWHSVVIEARPKPQYYLYMDGASQGTPPWDKIGYRFTLVTSTTSSQSGDYLASMDILTDINPINQYDPIDVSDLIKPMFYSNTSASASTKTMSGIGYSDKEGLKFYAYFRYQNTVGGTVRLTFTDIYGATQTGLFHRTDQASNTWSEGTIFEITNIREQGFLGFNATAKSPSINYGSDDGLWGGEVKANLIAYDSFGGMYPVTGVFNSSSTGNNCVLTYEDFSETLQNGTMAPYVVKHVSWCRVDGTLSTQNAYYRAKINYEQ